jgi:hypothetical protein
MEVQVVQMLVEHQPEEAAEQELLVQMLSDLEIQQLQEDQEEPVQQI